MPHVYDFEVSIRELPMPVVRRFFLRTTATFAHLHRAIQDSFGWENRHLWEFHRPSMQPPAIAGLPHDDGFNEPPPDAEKVKLSTYFTGKTVTEWCLYWYDFGDDWHHEVKLMGVQAVEEKLQRRLVDGWGATPPEDCGGVGGYCRILEFLQTGEDPWEDEPGLLESWLEGWRPDDFDYARVKEAFDR